MVIKFLKSGVTWLCNTKSIIKLFFKCLIAAIIVSFFFATIAYTFKLDAENPIDSESVFYRFFMMVVLAPVLETYLLQEGLNWILIQCRINKFVHLLLIQSSIFALTHCYSVVYVITIFGVGVSINFFFLRTKTLTTKYIQYTILLHASYNLIEFLLKYI